MKWSHHKFLIPGIGAVALVIGVVMVQTRAHIEYPMHVWRMDLDDALVGIGTILLGAAAIWTVWLKAKEASDKAEAVSERINGGLSSLAAQIMADELRQAGFETGLNERVTFLENHYEKCLEREIVWEEERKQIMEDRRLLRDLMNERLGEEG